MLKTNTLYRVFRTVSTVLIIQLLISSSVLAQEPDNKEKKPLEPKDYGKWERFGYGAQISPDGKWLIVPIIKVDGTGELQLYNLSESKEPDIFPQGTRPDFSEDSRWLAFEIGFSEEDTEILKQKSKPIRKKLGLVDLVTEEQLTFENVRTFSFSGTGAYLAFQKYLLKEKTKKPNPESEDGVKPDSSDVIVRKLSDGTNILFGNVTDYQWQHEGDLLAISIEAEDQTGNGIQLFSPDDGSLAVLDSSNSTYTGLSWREESDDLSVFRSNKDKNYDDNTQSILAWRDLTGIREMFVFDQKEISEFPENMKISQNPDLKWSKDGKALFFGIQEWGKKDKKESDISDQKEPESKPEKKEQVSKSKISDVQVWHSNDEKTIPMQEKQKQRDKQRGFLSVWYLDLDRFVKLGTDLMERVSVLEGGEYVIETGRIPYRFDNMFDRPRVDIYLVKSENGERRKIIDGVWDFEGGSSTGRYLLYFKDQHYRLYDIPRSKEVCLTCPVPASFVNEDYDVPVRKENPPWGYAGWLKDDRAVLLYDKFNIWAFYPDGSEAYYLTDGSDKETVHRYVQLDPEQKSINPDHPIYVSQYGEQSKEYGYGRIDISSGIPQMKTENLIGGQKRFSRLLKAENADVYAFISEDFNVSPNYFVGGGDLKNARQITQTNPFQEDYFWGHSEIIEYTNKNGKRLQGGLYYPADFKPDQKYPMIVYVYERLSQGVHNYTVPSERRPYNETVFTSQGYFVLRPDIVYTDRDPGPSAVECVTTAVKKALENQSIDSSNVGLVGHSWGGYEASFIPTQTNIFAASIAGAPLTNFFSFYGTFHWGPGMPESQHFETGQARMDVPYWEDMEAYVRNSPVMFIDKLKTPMMLFFGDADSVVDWHQGVEMYNYARRAGKKLVMLVYPGEDHGARKKENQIDYHRRVLQWFGHYLKGEDPPKWMSQGITALEREKILKKNEM